MADEPLKPGVPGSVAGAATVTPVSDPLPSPSSSSESGAPTPGPEDERGGGERIDRGISDFVRRAVSAGVGAASRSKDDIVRVAATEMRGWLEHLNLNEEIAKALSKMVIEVKTEIRFKPSEDGKLVPEATNDVSVKNPR